MCYFFYSFWKKKRTLIKRKLTLLYCKLVQPVSSPKHSFRNSHVLFSFRYCNVIFYQISPIVHSLLMTFWRWNKLSAFRPYHPLFQLSAHTLADVPNSPFSVLWSDNEYMNILCEIPHNHSHWTIHMLNQWINLL